MLPGAETEWGHLVKRPLVQVPENVNGDLSYSISNMCSENLIKMLMKPQLMSHPGSFLSTLQQESTMKLDPLQDVKTMHGTTHQKSQLISSEGTYSIQPQSSLDQHDVINSNSSSKAILPGKLNYVPEFENRTLAGVNTEKPSLEPEVSTDELSQLTSTGDCNEEKPAACPVSLQNPVNQPTFINQNQDSLQPQTSLWPMQPQFESLIYHSQQLDVQQSDCSNLNGLLPSLDPDEWKFYPSCQPLGGTYRSPGPLSVFGSQDPSALFPEAVNPPLPSMGQEIWDHQLNNLNILSQADQLTAFSHQDPCNISNGLRDLSDESYNQSGVYGFANVDVNNGGSGVVDPSVSSAILDDLCMVKNANFHNPSDYLVGNFSSCQDVQSQITTTTSLGDSQAFSRQDILDNSGGTSSSNVDFDEGSLLQNSSWQPVVPPVRTFTKV
jgi:auxin response factor